MGRLDDAASPATGATAVSGFLTAEAEAISRTLPPRLVEFEDDWAAFVIDWPTA